MNKKKTQEEFEEEVYNLVGNEYTVLGTYVNANVGLLIKHNDCNYEWKVEPHNFLNGQRCPVCGKIPKKVMKGINDIWTTNPKLAKLLANPEDGYKYTQFSGQKVDWKCPECGNIIKNRVISSINHQGLSCPRCGDNIPYSEKFMYNLLKQLDINFEYQYSPKWCKYELNGKSKYGIYDFYIPDYNCIIEVDGALGHGNDNLMSGQSAEESKKIDDIKNQLAIKHNIKIFRIDYRYYKNDKYNYIKQSILANEEFCELFNIHNINWQYIDELSQSSLIRKVCMYKNQHEDISTSEIGKIFKLNRATIRLYLIKGSKFEWCVYNPIEEKINGNLKSVSTNSKKVICLTTNKIYNSIAEAGRDMKINAGHISDCCNNKRKSAGKLYNGIHLQWMFLNNYNELKEKIIND